MKQRYILAAALTAAIPFQQENKNSECKDAPCAVEPVVAMPEQPHSLEEKPDAVAEVQYVEIPSSPPVFEEKGGEFHLDWESRTGEKARDVTDLETFNWIRERVAENKRLAESS